VITRTQGLSASANPEQRPQSAGFALSVNAENPAFWSGTVSVVQSFQLLIAAVRASGRLSSGKITAWHAGGSPY
jgi:hypothetical protein